MSREFPEHPILCVGAVVIDGDVVLLVQRGKEPQKGQWTIPGGMVELGERIRTAVRREIREETGVRVVPLELIDVFERIVRQKGSVRFHYIVLDYLCRVEGGKLRPSSDVADARWVCRANLPQYHLTPKARQVIEAGFNRTQSMP